MNQPEQITPSGIILPGDLGPTATRRVADGGALSDAELKQAAANAEANALEEEIESIVNTDLLPYKDDAPICGFQNVILPTGRQTKHLQVVQIPQWAHGRCVGSACGQFVAEADMCAVKLQGLLAARELGLLKTEEA